MEILPTNLRQKCHLPQKAAMPISHLRGMNQSRLWSHTGHDLSPYFSHYLLGDLLTRNLVYAQSRTVGYVYEQTNVAGTSFRNQERGHASSSLPNG